MRIFLSEARLTIAVIVLTTVRVRRTRTTKFVPRPTITDFTVLSNIMLHLKLGNRQLHEARSLVRKCDAFGRRFWKPSCNFGQA